MNYKIYYNNFFMKKELMKIIINYYNKKNILYLYILDTSLI